MTQAETLELLVATLQQTNANFLVVRVKSYPVWTQISYLCLNSRPILRTETFGRNCSRTNYNTYGY